MTRITIPLSSEVKSIRIRTKVAGIKVNSKVAGIKGAGNNKQVKWSLNRHPK